MEPNNGVLAHVRGEEVSAALRTLPPAGRGQPETMTADIDTLHVGRVRITFALQSYKRPKTLMWHWVAKRADPLEQ